MNTFKAIVGYSSSDTNTMIEKVNLVASVPTGGHDGDEEKGTEQLTVVQTQWGDLALCRTSNAYLGLAWPMPITYVDGSEKSPKKLAEILRKLADELENNSL